MQAAFHAALLVVCMATLFLVVRIGSRVLLVLRSFDERLTAMEEGDAGHGH